MLVGLRFHKVSSTVQSEIDRFFFALLSRKARAKNRDQDERRLAPRVELGSADRLDAELLPDRPLGALGSGAAEGQRFRVHDLSTTGCGLTVEPPGPFTRRQLVRLRLTGDGLDVELAARVIHIG